MMSRKEREARVELLATFKGTERFEVKGCLGAGGMGIVYEVSDRELGRRVALKTLRNMTPRGLVRFKREFRALRDLRHPNLVRFGELYEVGGQWFFTMELLRGGELLDRLGMTSTTATTASLSKTRDIDDLSVTRSTLAEVARGVRPPRKALRTARVDWDAVRRAFTQLFSGLAALHAAGKVHRDIKPSNLWLTSDERVVLLDFGLVLDEMEILRHEGSGVTGTVAYMSPEQAAGRRPTAQADCYAAGVVLYEALTGSRPFVGPVRRIIADKQRYRAPSARQHARGLPDDLVALAESLLARQPGKRPSATEALRQLGAAQPSAVIERAPTRRYTLLGRDDALCALRGAYDQACGQQGGTTVTLLHGAPGAGKRTLVEWLLADLSTGWEPPIVLRSRCVDRERIPFQAMDALMDGLYEALMRRTGDASLEALVAPLARTFPQLLPLLSADALAEPQERHGARALSELMVALVRLLSRVARERPVVIYLQDLQNIDEDSLALLSELVAAAEVTRVLLVCTVERSGDDEARRAADVAVRFAARRVDPNAVAVHHLMLEPLGVGHARALFTSLCEATHGPSAASSLAEQLVRGPAQPLMVCELARAVSEEQAVSAMSAADLDLDALLLARVGARDELQQRLLELLALAAAPLTASMLSAALCEDSGVARDSERDVQRALAALELDGLVAPARRGRWDAFEPRHRALASAISRQTPASRIRQLHRALLAAQGTLGELEPEALAVHLQGAGRPTEAARHYERAAHAALDALAFARAAQLYSTTLELCEAADRPRLLEHLAEAYIGAGRCTDAAHALLQAASSSDGDHALELRRRASEQLLRAGRTDAAIDELRPLLAELGMSLPRTMPGAMLSLLARRVMLRLRGLSLGPNAGRALSARDRARLDTCWAVAATVGLVDIVRGSDFQARHMALALDVGDPFRVGRALALEAGFMAAEPARRGEALRTLDRVAALVPHVEAPDDRERLDGFLAACTAFVELQRGFWKSGAEHGDRAALQLRTRCHGVDWEVDNAEIVAMWCHAQLGSLGELARRVRWACREAERRGDVHAATNLRVGLPNLAWLAEDDVEGARAASEQARRGLASTVASWQRAFDLLSRANIDLYVGDAARAHRRVEAEWPSMLRAMQLSVQLMRSLLTDLRGRAALAAYIAGDQRARAIVEVASSRLSQQQRWCRAHAESLRAGLEAVHGKRQRARARYGEAAQLYEACDMALHANAARHAAAVIAGDAATAEQHEGAVRALGVRAPRRLLAMLNAVVR